MARQPQDLGRAPGVLSGDVGGSPLTSGRSATGDPSARWEPVHLLDARIHKSLDLDDILQAAVEELGTRLGLDRCALLRIGPTGEFVATLCQYCASGVAPIAPDLALPRLHGLDRFLSRRGALILDDTSQNAQTRAIYSGEFDELGTRSLVCLPVCVEGVAKAVLTMAAVRHNRIWDEEEIAVGRAVSERLAAAIKQDELFRQLRESAREADALYRASSMLVDAVGVDQMYEQILDAVADVFGHPTATIWIVNDETREAILTYTRGEIPDDSPRSLSIDGVGLIAMAIRSGRAVNCPDVSRESRYFPGPQTTRSELIVPLKIDGAVLAVFNVESPRIGAFTERDERILSSFAERAARAVERERLYNQAEQAAARERLIGRITSLLNQSLDAQPIFQELVEQLGRHLGVNRCVVAQADSQRRTVAITHQYAADCTPVPAGLPFSNYSPVYDALVHGPVVSPDVSTDPALEGVREAFQKLGTRGFLAIPVSDHAGLRVLIACTTATPRQWRADELELVHALAAQAAIARERADLFREVTTSKVEWERTFNAMPEAVFVFNAERVLTRANSNAVELMGVQGLGFRQYNCCEVMWRAWGLNDCPVDLAMRTRQSVIREVMPATANRSFLLTVEPVSSEAAGVGTIVVVRDLTDIRRAEAETEKQKQFLSRLLEIAHDAVFVLDQEGRISWANQRLSDVTGYRPAELRRMRLPELITTVATAGKPHPPERSRVPESFEAQVTCKDGTRRYVLATSTPIYESGKLSGMLGMLHDITEVRTAADKIAQSEKLRALGQLAGGVAHNFNNLLAAILGHTQLLRRRLSTLPESERLDIIERAAMDGAAVVRRINSFSLQASDERFEPCDLNQLVRDSLDLTRTRWEDDARAQGITYTIDFRPTSIPQISGRASEVREVFVNIIFNALDAMAPRGGRLLVNTGCTPAGAFGRFSDEGIGMTEEVRKRIFEPFFTTKGLSGTGLGLSGSYAIIERHGGRIEVESSDGQGSSFTVWLPLARQKGVAGQPAGHQKLKPSSILVVDDDAAVRVALAEMLEGHGHQVFQASTAAEALDLLQLETSRCDVVFADLAMPDMDGLALARAIRAMGPGHDVPISVLLITGYSDSTLSDEERNLVDGVIPKPFHEEAILDALGQVLPE